jgi:phosphate-selective porin
MGFVIAVAAALLTITGCATHDKSGKEVAYTWERNLESDMKSFSHDFNKFWLADRPYMLREWHHVHD